METSFIFEYRQRSYWFVVFRAAFRLLFTGRCVLRVNFNTDREAAMMEAAGKAAAAFEGAAP